MGNGDSPWRPYIASNRSDCSVFVGNPVDGPPRWTSTTTSGSSRLMARPSASDLRSSPGPLVAVMPRWPANAAPTATAAAAISSSACRVRMPKFLCFDSSCRMSDAGVIGYEAYMIGRLARCAAAIRPYATARLPVMLRYFPGSSRAGWIW